jgi:hypothetical protein
MPEIAMGCPYKNPGMHELFFEIQLPAKQIQHFFQFRAQLLDDLLTLVGIFFGLGTGQTLPGPAYGKSLFVQETANLADKDDIVTLVVAPVTPALEWLQLGKFLLPVAQYMGLDCAQVADFTYGEITFTWNSG